MIIQLNDSSSSGHRTKGRKEEKPKKKASTLVPLLKGWCLAIYCKLRTTFYNTTAVVSGGRASSKERCISEFGLSYAAITVMPHSPRLVGDRGFEQFLPTGAISFIKISTTQKCKCTVTIPHIRQIPFPKGMLLESNLLHNPHPPPTWDGRA